MCRMFAKKKMSYLPNVVHILKSTTGPRTSSMSSETLMIGFECVLPTPGITLATFFTCLGSQPVRPQSWHTLGSNLGQMVVWAVKGHTAAEGMGTPAEEGQQHPWNKKNGGCWSGGIAGRIYLL